MSDYGIQPSGFVQKSLQDIKSELITDFKSIFGTNIDVTDDSVFGQLIGMLAKSPANVWELMQAVYSSQDPASAEGTSLDRIIALIGLTRLSPSSSTVTAILYGTQGTVVAAGKQASLIDTGELFSLNTSTTIDKADAISLEFEITTVADSTTYTLTIDGVGYAINSGVSATAESIMAAIKVLVDADNLGLTFTDNLDGTALLLSDDKITSFSYLVDANMTINEVGTNGDFTADVTGATPAPESTLTVIETPVSGWSSIDNLIAGTTGRAQETDEEARIRRADTDNIGTGGTEEAMRTAILQEVSGVTDVLPISNRTSSPVGSQPAKSIQMVVQGGDDQEIGEIIWDTIPAGIEPYGNTNVTVVDSTGRNQTMKFTRPTPKYLHVQIQYSLYSEETFPSDGETQIKNNIIDFAEGEYVIGKDVIYQRLGIPVYEVPGIGSITISVDVTNNPGDTPSYSSADISIAETELVQAAVSRIVTSLVP